MTTNQPRQSSYLTRIRNVSLLPGEKVACIFAPEDGILTEPTSEGRLLVTTNQRILSFGEGPNEQETMLLPVEELKGVSVSNGAQNSLSFTQGMMLIAAGFVIYLVVAYWLTSRFDGPSVPLINIDLAPLVVLITVLAGGWIAWKHYFAADGGSIRFQGDNWAFSFPYHEDGSQEMVYQVIDVVFSSRNARINGLWSTSAGDRRALPPP